MHSLRLMPPSRKPLRTRCTLAHVFRSPESLGFEAGDANLYRYVGNSPTNATDPSGLQAKEYRRLDKPRELTPEEIEKFKKDFLFFDPQGILVIGGADEIYNCIAHAVGLKGGRIDASNPPPGSNIKRSSYGLTGEYLDAIMKHYGFTRSKNCDSEPDKIKVALFGLEVEKGGKPAYVIRHAAVETGDGQWESKLGTDVLIRHPTLKPLAGDENQRGLYGKLLYCYEKPQPGANKKKK